MPGRLCFVQANGKAIITISCGKKQDEYLYSRFIESGGAPEEKHPLSFVIEGSNYLFGWFGEGIESRLIIILDKRDMISFGTNAS